MQGLKRPAFPSHAHVGGALEEGQRSPFLVPVEETGKGSKKSRTACKDGTEESPPAWGTVPHSCPSLPAWPGPGCGPLEDPGMPTNCLFVERTAVMERRCPCPDGAMNRSMRGEEWGRDGLPAELCAGSRPSDASERGEGAPKSGAEAHYMFPHAQTWRTSSVVPTCKLGLSLGNGCQPVLKDSFSMELCFKHEQTPRTLLARSEVLGTRLGTPRRRRSCTL